MAERQQLRAGQRDRRLPPNSEVGGEPVYSDKQLTIKQIHAPDRYRLQGSIDLYNVEAVAAWLGRSLSARKEFGRGGDVHVELSRLEFCDASGIRALVKAARQLNGDGRLILHGLPAQLSTAMKAVGWNDLPSLMIADRRGDDG